MAKCAECGQELASGVQFCMRCGHPVQAGAAGRGEKRVTVGEEGLFGKQSGPPAGKGAPIEVVQISPGSGGARRTTFEEPGAGFGGSPAAAVAVPAAGPRKTSLDEGPGGFGAQGASTARGPGVPSPLPGGGGGRPKTQLDEGPSRIVAPSVTRIVGWLVSFDFNETGQAYDLRAGRTRIGSSRDNDISLFFDQKASGLHATLIWRDGKCAVKDEASTNGTRVNGDDIGIGAVHALNTGDSLTVGASTFLVFLVDAGRSRELWPNLNG